MCRWRFCVCAADCRRAANARLTVGFRGWPIAEPGQSAGRAQAAPAKGARGVQTGCAGCLMRGNWNPCRIKARGWHRYCLDIWRTFETNCREAAMDQVIQGMHAVNSPQEWALHFLLRHAECRTALIAGTVACGQPEPLKAMPAPGCQGTEAAATDYPSDSFMAQGESNATAAPGESCAARFSRAFVAARHS